ncbi:hypothetical protein V5O48_014287 [Marasmius crinis-equi]|uniref:Nephrocystin 3-like N-terminal domain-containing protein n=1 Tax=Marasmius crinis-equi TaxID=585013 RepID=A0ABR3EXQ7_9AGAR
MSSINTSTLALRGEGPSTAGGIQQGENQTTYSGPTMIVSIRPQSTNVLGDKPEKFILVIESGSGETLRETKWDPSQGGWPVGIVLIRGSSKTESLFISLRRKRLRVYHQEIASGRLNMREVETAVHASNNQLEISLVIQAQNVLNFNGRRLALIAETGTPSLLPVWITSIRLAERTQGLTDKTLENLYLIFNSGRWKTFRIRESSWDPSSELWDVGLPLLRGSGTERLSIELRKKHRVEILHEPLATVILDLEELEQARKDSKKEITKILTLPHRNELNVRELVLAIQIGALDLPWTDTRQFALPSYVGGILNSISRVTGVVDKLSELHPAAELAWLVASVPLQLLQDKRKLDDELVGLIDTMGEVYGCATVKDDPLRNYGKFQQLFDTMIQESIRCFLFISNYISEGHLRHMADAPTKVQELTQAFRKLEKQFNDAQQYTTTVAALETRNMVSSVGNKVDLHQLEVNVHQLKADLEKELGNKRGFQLPSDLSRCLHGTRQRTLSRILGWIESEGEGSLLWLSGIAGSGKTSVMATVHDRLADVGCDTPLAAYVRFHRVDFPSPSKFVAALVYRLVCFDKLLGVEVAKILDARPNVFQEPLGEQFESLVVEPLRSCHEKVTKGRGRIVVMVDGLDECMEVPGGSDTFHDLLGLLSNPKTFASFPFLRLIVASRPEEPIHRRFTRPELNHITRFPLDTSSKETTSDVLHYLHVKFEEIFQIHPDFKAFCQERNALNVLANHSSGLFIWVVIVFRFVKRSPRERLEQALQLSMPHDSLDALNKLYSTVLNTIAAEQGDRDIKARVAPILGLIIAFGKVSLSTGPGLTLSITCGLLERLGYKIESIPSVLSQLGSVIEGVDSPQSKLVLLHKSFDDYLTDKSRAGEWFVDVEGHWSAELAESCLRIIHSNVFGDQPDYSDLSYFTHFYWTPAAYFQSDSSPVSELFSDILHRGFLRWIYVCTDLRLWGGERGSDPRVGSLGGLAWLRRMTTGPKIAQELGVAYSRVAPRLPPQLPEDLEVLFLSMLRGEMPEFSKCYMSLFSQISVPSSQRKDFHTILDAIREIRHSESADQMELFKPVPRESVTTNVEPINGVPDNEVLSSMLRDLNKTIRQRRSGR